MRWRDVASLAGNSVVNRGLRSGLTVLGIVIGVGAVIGLVGLGQGFQESITSQLDAFGGDTITITPGASRATGDERFQETVQGARLTEGLTLSDARVVEQVRGVELVHATVSGQATASYRGQSARVSLQGVEPDTWQRLETRDIVEGRTLVPGDTNSAVVTQDMAVGFFDQDISAGQSFEVDDQPFRIVGILEGGGGFGNQGGTVYVTADRARQVLEVENDVVSVIQVRLADADAVEQVSGDIEQRLLSHRGLREDQRDFTLVSGQEIQEQVASITGTFTAFLGSIAAIALLVGGIGIANTMYMSVVERSRLVGILKALGARKSDIVRLFLTESALLGLAGGILGVLFGYGLAIGVTEAGLLAFGPPGTDPPVVRPDALLVSGALAFSVIVGGVFGLMPALKAAKLDPIATLRDQ